MAKGRKRSITDEEIALIKAMLRQEISNDTIHFYFNRADRLISSGRVAQIKKGRYGHDVAEASQEAVDAFLAEWAKRHSSVPAADEAARSPTHHDVIRALFEKRGKGWFLISGET